MALPGRAPPPPRPARPRGRRILLAVVALLALAGLLLVRFSWQVRDLRAQRAVGPEWSFPSRVYSDDVPLVAGRRLPESQLLAELRARGYRPARSPLDRPGTYAVTRGGMEIFLRGFLDAHDPAGRGGPERVRLGLADGHLVTLDRLGGLDGATPPALDLPPRLEPVLVTLLFDEDRVRRSWVALERIPPVVRDAVIAAEDRRFARHLGLDARASARALLRNLRAGGVREGGSTISQQLARGLFLGRRRTVLRKLAEMPLAVGLELLLTKDQILEMYLNSIYWGQAGTIGIGGVAEASRWYFGLPVDSLQLNEAALLAGLIPAPNSYDPFEHPALALERRNAVLADMVEAGRLPAAEAARARARPLGARRGPRPIERFPSYAGYVREVIGRALPRRAGSWGLDVFTTLDLPWQREAEVEVARRVAALGGGGLEAAFVAIEPSTGAVRAMVGGRAPREGDFNRATQARRQTGSAIKPIVYAAALAGEGGGSFLPSTVVADTLRTFGTGRSAWTPRNYDDTYHEQVTLALALALSLNVATANLVEEIGPRAVVDVAARCGLPGLKPVRSIGLGTNEATLLQLTGAYAVFANGGVRREPSPIRVVVDAAGERMLEPPAATEQALPPGIAALMTGLLEFVVRAGVAAPLHTVYGFDRPVAGKTGTTNDYRDAWFIGYTPDLVAGVWVGYDRPRSLGRAAAHTAIPVWAGVMGRLVGGAPAMGFASEAELEYATIDPWTGMLADTMCARASVPFLRGTAPTLLCVHGLTDPMYGPSDSLFAPDSLGAEGAWSGDSLAVDSLFAADSLTMEPDPVDTSSSPPP